MRELTPKERAAMDRALRASAEIVPDPRDDRITELEREVDRLVRINKSFGAEIKRLRKLKGEPDNWSPTLDKGDE